MKFLRLLPLFGGQLSKQLRTGLGVDTEHGLPQFGIDFGCSIGQILLLVIVHTDFFAQFAFGQCLAESLLIDVDLIG